MHGRERGVDGVGDALRAGRARGRRGGVRTPILSRIFVPERIVANLEQDLNVGKWRCLVTAIAPGHVLDIQTKSVIGILRIDVVLGTDQITVGVRGAEDRRRSGVGVCEYPIARIGVEGQEGTRIGRSRRSRQCITCVAFSSVRGRQCRDLHGSAAGKCAWPSRLDGPGPEAPVAPFKRLDEKDERQGDGRRWRRTVRHPIGTVRPAVLCVGRSRQNAGVGVKLKSGGERTVDQFVGVRR